MPSQGEHQVTAGQRGPSRPVDPPTRPNRAVLPYPGNPLRWLTIAVSNSDSSTLKSAESVRGGEAARPGSRTDAAQALATPSGSLLDVTGCRPDDSTDGGADAAHATLDALGPGNRGQVVWIDPALQAELVQHGLIEGAVVRLESRAPFGGPVVLGIGRARLAIGRGLARQIHVERIA